MSLYFNNSLYKFNNRPVQQVVTIPIIKKKRKRKKKEKEVVTDNKLLLLILKELKKKKNPKKTKKKKKKGKRFKKNRYGLGKSKPIISRQKPGETDDEYKRRIVIQELSIKNPLLSILADNMNNSNILPLERINEIEQLISNPLSELIGLDKLKNLFNELNENQKVSFKNTPLGRRLNNELVSKIPREDFSNDNDFETLLKQDIRNKQQVKDNIIRRELRSRVSPPNFTDEENIRGVEEVVLNRQEQRERDNLMKEWSDKDTGDDNDSFYFEDKRGNIIRSKKEFLNSIDGILRTDFEKKLKNKYLTLFKLGEGREVLTKNEIKLNEMLRDNHRKKKELIGQEWITEKDTPTELTALEIAKKKIERLERTTEDEFLQDRVLLRERVADIED